MLSSPERPRTAGGPGSPAPRGLLCHHGARSQRVAMYLASNGFDTVANIAGGIDAWALECDGSIPRY